MAKMIFVSIPVSDLAASVVFYKALGFGTSAECSDETGVCMVWSETIRLMLLTHAKWQTFSERPISPKGTNAVMLALTCDDRPTVDAMNNAAAANGGTGDINPIQDLGFMYGRDFADPDGHAWGAMWMDPAAMPVE